MSRILAIAYVKVLSVLIYIPSFSFVFGNYIIAWLHYILDSCVSNHTFLKYYWIDTCPQMNTLPFSYVLVESNKIVTCYNQKYIFLSNDTQVYNLRYISSNLLSDMHYYFYSSCKIRIIKSNICISVINSEH